MGAINRPTPLNPSSVRASLFPCKWLNLFLCFVLAEVFSSPLVKAVCLAWLTEGSLFPPETGEHVHPNQVENTHTQIHNNIDLANRIGLVGQIGFKSNQRAPNVLNLNF